LEPFGVEVDFMGHAITASTIANRHRNKNEKAHSVEDFMPKFETENQTPDQMIQTAAVMTMALGGVDLREDE
jgi:hypothetical protein